MADDYYKLSLEKPTGVRGWIYRTAVNFAAGVGRVLLFWKPEGMENIPREGGTLVVANHPSFLEPPSVVCIMIYFGGRDVSIMAWHKLFHIPIVRFFTKTYKAYPVNRDRPGRGPYVTLMNILKQGGAAGVFPEGSRSEQRLMGPWKPGALRAAFATKATILPVSFVTVGEFWLRGQWRPRFFRKHHIKVHKPLTYDEYIAEKPNGMREKEYQEILAGRIRGIINEPIIKRINEHERHIETMMRKGDPFGEPSQDRVADREARYAAARARLRPEADTAERA